MTTMIPEEAARKLPFPMARLDLPVRGKPYFVATTRPGKSLGYRRLKDQAGTWCVRIADGQGGNNLIWLGTADDLLPTNGREILNYEEAFDRARETDRRVLQSAHWAARGRKVVPLRK